MRRRPPRSTPLDSSAASDVYKRQGDGRGVAANKAGFCQHQIESLGGARMLMNHCSSFNRLGTVSYTHLRAHETSQDIVCRLLLEKKKLKTVSNNIIYSPPSTTTTSLLPQASTVTCHTHTQNA